MDTKQKTKYINTLMKRKHNGMHVIPVHACMHAFIFACKTPACMQNNCVHVIRMHACSTIACTRACIHNGLYLQLSFGFSLFPVDLFQVTQTFCNKTREGYNCLQYLGLSRGLVLLLFCFSLRFSFISCFICLP